MDNSKNLLKDLERRENNNQNKQSNSGSYKPVRSGWTKYKGNLTIVVDGRVEYI